MFNGPIKYSAIYGMDIDKPKCQCGKNAVGSMLIPEMNGMSSVWVNACNGHLKQGRRDGLKTRGLEL
tara:strand:- start:1258 stop:1458 length:201 start_codon:yes stop_codon:yes gene_type:complete